mgnify:CR=1 FL=1
MYSDSVTIACTYLKDKTLIISFLRKQFCQHRSVQNNRPDKHIGVTIARSGRVCAINPRTPEHTLVENPTQNCSWAGLEEISTPEHETLTIELVIITVFL